MATYREVRITFWQDEFVLNLTPEEKFFYLYLMTNSKTTQCGIYEIPKKVMEFETGYNNETVTKLLNRFIEYGKILYSEDTKEIFLVNWVKYNRSDSPKVKSLIYKELNNVKNPDYARLYVDAAESVGYELDHTQIQYLYSMDTQSPETETETETEAETKAEAITETKQSKSKPKAQLLDIQGSPELVTEIQNFIDYRKEIKAPMTDRAIKLLVSQLNKLADNDKDKIAILQQSIVNGWKGIFAIKGNGNNRSNKPASFDPETYDYEAMDSRFAKLEF